MPVRLNQYVRNAESRYCISIHMTLNAVYRAIYGQKTNALTLNASSVQKDPIHHRKHSLLNPKK